MKRWMFFGLVFLLSLSAQAGVSIISDLDDTIKITRSDNVITSFPRAVFKNDVFTGIPEFFNEARSYANEVHIVTASPDVLKPKIKKTLSLHKIKVESISLRSIRNPQDKITYKVSRIKEIMEKSSDDFILLGDDVGKDPEVYEKIKELFPNRVLAAYIHVIKDREFSKDLTRMYSLHDLAIYENLAGRMSDESTQLVLQKVLDEKNLKYVIPYFAACPTQTDTWDAQMTTSFAATAKLIVDRLVSFCEYRRSHKLEEIELELAQTSLVR